VRTHRIPHGTRTYAGNHVCISQDYFSQRYIARYFQHHLRHHHGETISYVTSYYVRNVHGHSQAWYFFVNIIVFCNINFFSVLNLAE